MQGDVQSRKLEMRIKVLGLMALLASGAWTLYKWRDDRKVDVEHRVQELNRVVFEKQTTLYFEASSAASTIATSDDEATKKAAANKFYELYFGELVIVEDRRVELAMIQYSRCLNLNRDGCERTVLSDFRGTNFSDDKIHKLPPATLQNLSLELSACMRSALEFDRGIDFGKLSDPISTCPYD